MGKGDRSWRLSLWGSKRVQGSQTQTVAIGPRQQMDVGVAEWSRLGAGARALEVCLQGWAHLRGRVKCPGPHPSPGLRGCVPAPLPCPHPPEGLQAAFWVLQDGTQVGHHGSRQLAAAEVQGAERRALPQRADQVLKGFLEAGLLHPGDPADLRDCRGFPPLPLPPRPRPHLSVCSRHPGQARPSHSTRRPASLSPLCSRLSSVRAGAALRASDRSPQAASGSLQWHSLWAGSTRPCAAPRPPRCTPTAPAARALGAGVQAEGCWLRSLPCSSSPRCPCGP